MSKPEDLSSYRVFGFTLLQFMAIVAVVGIVVAIVLNYFF
jgi:Tfp pilus assembly protein PilE